MRSDLSWVTPQLAIGGHLFEEDLPALCELGIRHVVDVRLEQRDDEALLRRHGIQLFHLPTLDQKAVSQPLLDEAVGWVSPLLDSEQRIHVHCEHGVGRSAQVGLCILVFRGMAPLDALLLAKNAREKISPSPEQLEGLLTFCRRFKSRTGAPWSVPTFDRLARVAYRHLAEGMTSAGGIRFQAQEHPSEQT